MEKEDALKNAEIMLSLGGSYSEVADFLKQKGVPNPAEIITETVNQWVDEDKQLSESRRAIQRRRLMRQVRLAMDEAKVGDAVRAEAILARLDDQEADAEANRTTNEFDDLLETRTEEEVEFFVEHSRWPVEGELAGPKEEGSSDDEPVH